jgi:hypothetical protein
MKKLRRGYPFRKALFRLLDPPSGPVALLSKKKTRLANLPEVGSDSRDIRPFPPVATRFRTKNGSPPELLLGEQLRLWSATPDAAVVGVDALGERAHPQRCCTPHSTTGDNRARRGCGVRRGTPLWLGWTPSASDSIHSGAAHRTPHPGLRPRSLHPQPRGPATRACAAAQHDWRRTRLSSGQHFGK